MEEDNSTKNQDYLREDLKWTADRLFQSYNTHVDRAIRALLLVDSGGIVIVASIVAGTLPNEPQKTFIFAILSFVISLVSTGFLLLLQVIVAYLISNDWSRGVNEIKNGSLSKEELGARILNSRAMKYSKFFGFLFGIASFFLWIVGCIFSLYGLFQFKGPEAIW